MRRTYTQIADPQGRRRRRRAQQGQDIFDFVKKVAKHSLVRLVAKKTLNMLQASIITSQKEQKIKH